MFSCLACGQTWQRDPALEVPCPTCRASIGQRCRRPSGHQASEVHADRDRHALEVVPGYGRCPAAAAPPAPPAMQQSLWSDL